MYALLAALTLLFPPPDLSNHWRWASASVNQSSDSPTPLPSPTPQPNPPTPNPTPIPSPTPSPFVIGAKCPNCDKGWLTTDSVVKERCWKCKGDGIINDGDPILGSGPTENAENLEDKIKSSPQKTTPQENGTKATPYGPEENSPSTKDGSSQPRKEEAKPNPVRVSNDTLAEAINRSLKPVPDQTIPEVDDPESKQICYKPIYSKDGYWIWDLDGKKWVRSSKQPPTYATVPAKTGHYEQRAYQYKSCNGRNCVWKTGYKKVWVNDPPTRVLQPAAPRTSHYPVRGSYWTGCSSYRHLMTGPHSGKFSEAWLRSLSWEELQSIHSDHHEELRYGRPKVKWQYVNN